MAKQEIVNVSKQSAGLALAEKYGVSTGHVDTSALSTPFLSLAQGLSPELNPASEGYIADLKLGHFFIKGKSLGDTLKAVLCYGDQEYVEWTQDRKFVAKYPITSDRITRCKKGTGKDQYKDFTPEGNQLVKTYVLFMLVETADGLEPVVFPAKSTMYKAAADFHADASKSGLLFLNYARLRSIGKSKDGDSWFVFGHQILDEEVPDDIKDKAAELARLAESGRATASHADSAYSATSYDNKKAVDENVVNAMIEKV